MVTFIYDYARVPVVTRVKLRSNVVRSLPLSSLLAEAQDQIITLRCRGYIFFGSTLQIMDSVMRSVTLPPSAASLAAHLVPAEDEAASPGSPDTPGLPGSACSLPSTSPPPAGGAISGLFGYKPPQPTGASPPIAGGRRNSADGLGERVLSGDSMSSLVPVSPPISTNLHQSPPISTDLHRSRRSSASASHGVHVYSAPFVLTFLPPARVLGHHLRVCRSSPRDAGGSRLALGRVRALVSPATSSLTSPTSPASTPPPRARASSTSHAPSPLWVSPSSSAACTRARILSACSSDMRYSVSGRGLHTTTTTTLPNRHLTMPHWTAPDGTGADTGPYLGRCPLHLTMSVTSGQCPLALTMLPLAMSALFAHSSRAADPSCGAAPRSPRPSGLIQSTRRSSIARRRCVHSPQSSPVHCLCSPSIPACCSLPTFASCSARRASVRRPWRLRRRQARRRGGTRAAPPQRASSPPPSL